MREPLTFATITKATVWLLRGCDTVPPKEAFWPVVLTSCVLTCSHSSPRAAAQLCHATSHPRTFRRRCKGLNVGRLPRHLSTPTLQQRQQLPEQVLDGSPLAEEGIDHRGTFRNDRRLA